MNPTEKVQFSKIQFSNFLHTAGRVEIEIDEDILFNKGDILIVDMDHDWKGPAVIWSRKYDD